jgi:hypothetical protein
MKLIYVKATTGLKFPKAGDPRNFITDQTPVPVEDSHYYRKAILDKDLVLLSDKEVADFKAAQEKAEKAAIADAEAKAKAAADAAKAKAAADAAAAKTSATADKSS